MAAKRTRKSIDKKKLYSLIKQGKSAQDIMKTLKIGLKQSLKSALFDLSVEKGEVLSVPGMTARATGNRKINKVGLQIPLSQLEGHFAIGDEFDLSLEKDKIVLKKV